VKKQSAEKRRWIAIQEECVQRAAFDEAWQALEQAGAGTENSIEHCFRLIQSSAYHRKKFKSTALNIIDDFIELTRNVESRPDGLMTKEEFNRLGMQVTSKLMTTAAIYLAYGAIVGIGSVGGVRR